MARLNCGQSRRGSAFEAALNILIGSGVAYLGNMVILPVVGITITGAQNITITAFFTLVSVARSYCVRRFFNWLCLRAKPVQRDAKK